MSETLRRSDPTAALSAERLTAYLNARQENLVDRSIEIAKTHGYAPFTTTIRAAWVEAVQSITESIGFYVADSDHAVPGPQATKDYSKDDRFARMRRIARLHRSLGITMQMYLGLFKHFRNIYLDTLTGFSSGDDLGGLKTQVRDFFDETELSISADWTESGDNDRLRELQDRTRTLTLEKDRYFAIFESLRNPAFLLNHRKQLVNANQAVAELFLGDAQAGDILYLRSMRRRKSTLQQALKNVLEAAAEPDRTVWLETLAGRRCFDVRMRALHDAVDNTALGYVLLLNDVTAHRRAVEKAQKAERQMSRFLATMSHEIRTPLHGVLGATDLLRTASRENHANYLDVIESAGQSLLQTLNNVLDYSKLENSPPTPQPAATDLRRAMEAFRRVATIGAENEDTRVSIRLSPDLPHLARVDWSMTRQVLTNLVSNAIRFDDGQGVEVWAMPTRSQNAPSLRFEVRDHGPGIAEEDARALFQPFDETSARDTGSGGSGLGLAIAHHLVEAMEGRIGYRNLEAGALIWFELPCLWDVTGAVPDVAATFRNLGSPPAERKCLLVDDDPAGAMVTAHHLERLGCSVDSVGTVAEAVEASSQEPYDIFVVDYLLPDGNGPTLVRTLKQQGNAGRFVAFTANVEVVKESDEMSLLFDAVLAKPADQTALGEAIMVPGATETTARPQSARASALSELSPKTAVAMAETFAKQWDDFRARFKRLDTAPQILDLGYAAHRLAGSSALLGLHELELPLRTLERRCNAGDKAETIAGLLHLLDRDLSDCPSWRAIEMALEGA